MRRLLIAGMGIAAWAAIPASAAAPDVAEFTQADAAALMEDEPVDPATPPTRAWSFGGARPQATPAPASPARAGLAASRTPAGTAVTERKAAPRRLLPLQFGLASSELSRQSRANLQNLAAVLLDPRHLDKRVRIVGHADKSGSPELNQKLSEERAGSAVAYLERVGVNPARLEAVGVSFEDPLPGLSEFDPRNRRVEIERVR